MYTPSWWPSIWFGHSILALLVVASIAWNWFSFHDTNGLSTNTTNGGLEAMARAKNDEKQPYPLIVWYKAAGKCGCSKGTALLLLIVGLLALVTVALTVLVLRGIGIVLALV